MMDDSNGVTTGPEQPDSLKALLDDLAGLEGMDLPLPARTQLAQARLHAEELGAATLQAEQKVEEVNRARAKFISMVTHELRLPLTSIKGYTDLVRQGMAGPVNEQQQSFLGVVRSNVDRMTALIADLSDMSHAQSGRIKLSLQITHLNKVLDDVMLHLQPKMDEKQQVFTLELPENPGALQADPVRLGQILTIMLGNAQRYTPAGGKIGLRASEEDRVLTIHISDTGCGISDEDQAKLFTPFFRSEDEAVREHHGWGLSLYVASLLVGLMGGEIGAESELRKGSTFWFSVPMDSVDQGSSIQP